MTQTNHRVLLKQRPLGPVTDDVFDFDEQPVGEPGDGEVLVRNLFLSVDPYMRGRMNDVKSYVPPFAVGEPLQGGVVGEVVASRAEGYAEGDTVMGMLGWEQYSIADGRALRPVVAGDLPLSYHLGILGMPGLTAWVGLNVIGACKPGDAVLVSAASGAVGSVVGQIARNQGCYVVGSAGSDDKVAWLRDSLGFDVAFNYKTVDSIHAAVHKAFPKGIDVNFENVGGDMLEAAIWNMAPCGRTALSGRSVRMEGFIVSNHLEHAPAWDQQCREWIAAGKLEYRESVADGLAQAPAAFMGLMTGQNFGKQIVKIAD